MAGKHFLMGLLSTLAALSLASPVPVMAQGTPDLTGSWIVDTAKSDPAPPVRSGPGFGRGGGNPNQMVITRTATELVVAQGGATYIYNLDGTERTGPPGGETKSLIAWQDGKLVVTWKREFFAGPDKGYVTSTGKDVYTLTGNVLTVEKTSTVPPQGPKTRVIVYNKGP